MIALQNHDSNDHHPPDLPSTASDDPPCRIIPEPCAHDDGASVAGRSSVTPPEVSFPDGCYSSASPPPEKEKAKEAGKSEMKDGTHVMRVWRRDSHPHPFQRLPFPSPHVFPPPHRSPAPKMIQWVPKTPCSTQLQLSDPNSTSQFVWLEFAFGGG